MKIQRWRAVSLIGINLLIITHLIIYYVIKKHAVGGTGGLFDQTLLFFGDGVLRTGAIIGLTIFVVTLLFGRVFCGWACHCGAFQDGGLYTFKKSGVNPSMRYSLAGKFFPFFILLGAIGEYIVGYWREFGVPKTIQMNVAAGEPWSALPEVPGVFLAFAVNGFLVIYYFGARAFCRYTCPWGLLLSFFDFIGRPFNARIKRVGECKGCMTCTKNCIMGIDVNSQTNALGEVNDVNCIRCLNCVSNCPTHSLKYKFGRCVKPSDVPLRPKPMTSFGPISDLLLVATGLLFYFTAMGKNAGIFVGVSMGLLFGLYLRYVVRMVKDEISTPSDQRVKLLSPEGFKKGFALLAFTLLLVVMTWQTTYRLYTFMGVRRIDQIDQAMKDGQDIDSEAMNRAIELLQTARNMGNILRPVHYLLGIREQANICKNLGILYSSKGAVDRAIKLFQEALTYRSAIPMRIIIRCSLGKAYAEQGAYEKAEEQYLAALKLAPSSALALKSLGALRSWQGYFAEAINEYKKAIEVDPTDNATYAIVAKLYEQLGQSDEAEKWRKRGTESPLKQKEVILNKNTELQGRHM